MLRLHHVVFGNWLSTVKSEHMQLLERRKPCIDTAKKRRDVSRIMDLAVVSSGTN